MQRIRKATAVVVVSLAVVFSCNGSPEPSSPSKVTYGDSECGTCVQEACSGVLDQCAAEPSCSVFLSCLYACPVGPKGDADPACEAACPGLKPGGAHDPRRALEMRKSARFRGQAPQAGTFAPCTRYATYTASGGFLPTAPR
jgi:hypothetical protein